MYLFEVLSTILKIKERKHYLKLNKERSGSVKTNLFFLIFWTEKWENGKGSHLAFPWAKITKRKKASVEK